MTALSMPRRVSFNPDGRPPIPDAVIRISILKAADRIIRAGEPVTIYRMMIEYGVKGKRQRIADALAELVQCGEIPRSAVRGQGRTPRNPTAPAASDPPRKPITKRHIVESIADAILLGGDVTIEAIRRRTGADREQCVEAFRDMNESGEIVRLQADHSAGRRPEMEVTPHDRCYVPPVIPLPDYCAAITISHDETPPLGHHAPERPKAKARRLGLPGVRAEIRTAKALERARRKWVIKLPGSEVTACSE